MTIPHYNPIVCSPSERKGATSPFLRTESNRRPFECHSVSPAIFALFFCLPFAFIPVLPRRNQPAASLGAFNGHSDVGAVIPPGKATYSPATGTYSITAAGWDLWSTTDGFHFVWKKLSGDLSLSADIDFPEKTGDHIPFEKQS